MSRSSRAPLAVAVLLVPALAAALLAPVAAAQTDEERRLSSARARLAELTTEIDQAEEVAGDAEVALDDADERLREIEGIVNDVAAQVEQQQRAVADAQQRLDEVEAEAAELEQLFGDRVARMFKQGPTLSIELLLSSEGAEDALARTSYLRHISEGDRLTIESLDAAQVAVSAERARVADEQRRLENLLEEQQAVFADVEALRERRALAAAEAREQVRLLAEEQDDLEDEQAELEALIRRRQEEERRQREAQAQREREAQAQRDREAQRQREQAAASSSSAAASSSSGGSSAPASGGATTSAPSSSGFAWPLCAPVTSEYGPRWGRMHRGIDQGAPTGAAIGASKSGTVIFAGWQGGYGNLVLIDHHDGVVTAYAHMSSIGTGVGASVSQGQTIGRVGSTGNSTGPHLHFETRVNGSAVNPRQYLSGGPC